MSQTIIHSDQTAGNSPCASRPIPQPRQRDVSFARLALATNFRFTEIILDATPKSPLRPSPIPSHTRGVGHRHERGTGCGGRGSVGRVLWAQGGLVVRERTLAAQTTGANIRMNPSAKPAVPGEALWAKP